MPLISISAPLSTHHISLLAPLPPMNTIVLLILYWPTWQSSSTNILCRLLFPSLRTAISNSDPSPNQWSPLDLDHLSRHPTISTHILSLKKLKISSVNGHRPTLPHPATLTPKCRCRCWKKKNCHYSLVHHVPLPPRDPNPSCDNLGVEPWSQTNISWQKVVFSIWNLKLGPRGLFTGKLKHISYFIGIFEICNRFFKRW